MSMQRPIGHEFSDYDILKFRQVFNLFDPLRTGSIPNSKMGDVLQSLGQIWTDRELDQLVQQADADQSGSIEFDEFVDLMERTNKTEEEIDLEAKAAFKEFDADKSGFITCDELTEALTATGYCGPGKALTPEIITQIFIQCDQEGDGKLTLEEFRS